LGVKLSGLDFHAFVAEDGGSAGLLVLVSDRGRRYIPSLLLVGIRKLDLDSVDTIDAVDEEDQDEDKGYLHAVL
jgi:hypothetical protein